MRRLAILCIIASAIVTVLATSASAHVEVMPSTAKKGAYQMLTFSVPNESDTASTVRLDVTIPQNRAITTVRVQPKPGWNVAVQKTNGLVTTITWTGGTIAPDQFDLFTIAAGPLPKAKQVVFKALQTYSDGTVVRWIEPQAKGAPEPEHPAPVLTLKGTAASAD
jgi:uncharacterized protein YcnI